MRFEVSKNDTLPTRLQKIKRSIQKPRIYDFHFDYNFKNLRRAGGEIYFRADFSNHPGYWDAVVSSPAGTKAKRELRTRDNWRTLDKRWVEEFDATKWNNKFDDLLNKDSFRNWGLSKVTDFAQTIYDGQKPCQGVADARLRVHVQGHYETKIDYGTSLVGSLKNFKFSEAYGYIRELAPEFRFSAEINGEARLNFQSDFVKLLGKSDLGIAGLNIKGILEIGPYHNIEAQLGASGTISGRVFAQAMLNSTHNIDHRFPVDKLGAPRGDYSPSAFVPEPVIFSEHNIDFDGQIITSVKPILGFRLRLNFRGQMLMDTALESSMQVDTTVEIHRPPPDCDGHLLGVTMDYKAELEVKAPFSFWDNSATGNKYQLFDSFATPLPAKCYRWGVTPLNARRSVPLDVPSYPYENATILLDGRPRYV